MLVEHSYWDPLAVSLITSKLLTTNGDPLIVLGTMLLRRLEANYH